MWKVGLRQVSKGVREKEPHILVATTAKLHLPADLRCNGEISERQAFQELLVILDVQLEVSYKNFRKC